MTNPLRLALAAAALGAALAPAAASAGPVCTVYWRDQGTYAGQTIRTPYCIW